MKNHVTGNFILSPKGKEAFTRTFNALGLEWEHAVEDTKDSLKTSGPLPEAIDVLVSLLACGGLSCPLWPLSGPYILKWPPPGVWEAECSGYVFLCMG